MPDHLNQPVGSLLVKNKVIEEKMLEEALNSQTESGKKLGKILIEKGYIDEQNLYLYLGKQLGIEFQTEIHSDPHPEYFKEIPYEYCIKNNIAPWKEDSKTISIYLSDPTNTTIINELSFMTGKKIETDYATDSAITAYLKKIPDLKIGRINQENDASQLEAGNITGGSSPVVKYLNNTINDAITQKASDIHLEIFSNKTVLKYRIDGRLTIVDEPDKNLYPGIISRIKIMSDLDISEKRLPQDGKAVVNHENRQVDIRISIIPTIYGENAVLRILDREKSVLSVDSLGLTAEMLETLIKEAVKPNGMMLVTGPTGSGKTTTLYAVLQYIKQFNQKIITIEDPVEYRIDGVSQVQAHPGIGLTFAAGLRSFLRHDPDIIMVGEIRDKETADIAIRAALTGHLVLSTIHTNGTIETIIRFIDMGIPPYLLSSTLNLIIAQRLVRKTCIYCSGKGCVKCRNSGFSGRIAIFEFLKISKNIKDAVNRGLSAAQIREIAQKEGFISLKEYGRRLADCGMTTIEEIEKNADSGD